MNDIQSPEVFSAKLIDEVVNADEGLLKNASEASTKLIKRSIKENGFSRTIIPPKTVTRSDLNVLPNTEMPVIIEEMEAESPQARAFSFDDAPDSEPFRGQKFVIYFFTITTAEFTKNVYELLTYTNDFRQITTDNALRELQTAEDGHFMSGIDTIVGTAETADGAAGYEQNHEVNITDALAPTRVDYSNIGSYLEDHDLNNGLFLLNRRSAKWFQNFDRTELGGDLAQSIFQEGVSALQEFKIFGNRHASTIKRTLVPNSVIYQFTEPNYLGRFYILQDVTMFVEKKRDILRFSATEKIGMAIPNVAGAHKVKFI
jgi:hypothetical protein